jgi:hypothetical protein
MMLSEVSDAVRESRRRVAALTWAVYDALMLISERHECTDLELLAAVQDVQRRIIARELTRSRGEGDDE